jgi:hypothetical protein
VTYQIERLLLIDLLENSTFNKSANFCFVIFCEKLNFNSDFR